MKEIEDIVCCVVDAGTFIPLADMMGHRVAKAFYYSPFEQEYLGIERCCVGDGMPHFERLDDFLDPEVFDTVDLWCFPDIGFGGLQRDLRRRGKLVFGSMGASDLELFRTRFIKTVEGVGLPMVHSQKCVGLTALDDYLFETKRKWVKINRYRDNMETWFHIDYQHSQRELERLAAVFGPLKEHVIFVVQDEIEEEDGEPVLEVGYDGWCIDGQFPPSSFQGYEKKNELYLGSELAESEQPEEVRLVNERFAPVLADYGYRNFWATEIRIKDKVPYFIDPTPRMAGQTMEHLLETCKNLPEIILAGAQGEVLKPNFTAGFAAEATLHYKSNGQGSEWKTFRVPKEAEPWTKLYRCCFCDGAYQFPPHRSDELGVVTGAGDSIEGAVADMQEHFEALKDEPVSIEMSGFVDLLEQIQTAQGEGVKFTDQPIPAPEAVAEEKP